MAESGAFMMEVGDISDESVKTQTDAAAIEQEVFWTPAFDLACRTILYSERTKSFQARVRPSTLGAQPSTLITHHAQSLDR